MRKCFVETHQTRCTYRFFSIDPPAALPANSGGQGVIRRGCDSVPLGVADSSAARGRSRLASTGVQVLPKWWKQIGDMTCQTLTLLAPIVLFVLTFVIIGIGDGWFTVTDLAFLCVLLAFVSGRASTSRKHPKDSAYREPANAAVLTFGLAVWVVANILGNILLAS